MQDAHWIALAVVVPMGAAILSTLLRGWIAAQRLVGILSMVTVAVVAAAAVLGAQRAQGGVLLTQMGGWEAPYGITVAIDALSGLLVLAASLVTLCCYIHGFSSLRKRVEARWFHPLVQLLLMGVNFSFMTGDLFNLFVAFEIMLMSSYALLALGGSRRAIVQAHKYVMLNLVASTFFVLGAGLMYGIAGTLNYADLARFAAEAAATGETPTGFVPVSVMLLFVFAFKAAVFPLWFWLPDTYHTCPLAIGAMFGGLLTKVGVYTLLKLTPLVFAVEGATGAPVVRGLLAVSAGVTMVLAIYAALGATEIRRMLAMILISHIGYLVFGVAMMTEGSMAGTLFYMLQHMLVMGGLFLCCGLIERHGGTGDVGGLGGLHAKAPWLSVLFFVGMLSLVGVPPLSGFYGKVLILRDGFDPAYGEHWWMLSVAGLVTGAATLLAVGKTWGRVFWSESQHPAQNSCDPSAVSPTQKLGAAYAGATGLIAMSVGVAVCAEPGMKICNAATAHLSSPGPYVQAVLGPGAWDTVRHTTENQEGAVLAVTAEEHPHDTEEHH